MKFEQRYKIRYALPGPSADWAAVRGLHIASKHHDVLIPNDIGHDTCGNFDTVWCEAVNAFEAGEISHLILCHADVHQLEEGWLDGMVWVADKHEVSVVSATVAIKDNRAVVSCGRSNDPDGNEWLGHLVKIESLDQLPMDFDSADLGAPGHALLHNTGCILFDLRDERLRATDENDDLKICFNFPRRNRRDPETGMWRAEGNSEDFYISRIIHQLGVKSRVTRRVKTMHSGRMLFPNWDWRKDGSARVEIEKAKEATRQPMLVGEAAEREKELATV